MVRKAAVLAMIGGLLFTTGLPACAGEPLRYTTGAGGIVFQIEPLFPSGGGLAFAAYVFSGREGADFSLEFLLPARTMLPGQEEPKLINIFFSSVDPASGKLTELTPETSVEMQVLTSGKREIRQGVLVRGKTESKAGRGVRVLLVELPSSTIQRVGELNIETVLFVFRGRYQRDGENETLTVRRQFKLDDLVGRDQTPQDSRPGGAEQPF